MVMKSNDSTVVGGGDGGGEGYKQSLLFHSLLCVLFREKLDNSLGQYLIPVIVNSKAARSMPFPSKRLS